MGETMAGRWSGENDLPTEKVPKEERQEGEVVRLEKPLSGTALLLVGLED